MWSTSSVADVLRYLQTRFGLVRFVPLSLYLGLAGSAADDPPTIGSWLIRSLLVLPWLLQFRLADDLADLPRDRRDHPDRVLVRAALGPFVVLLALLTAGNALLAGLVLPALRWVEFLVLTCVMALWYGVTHRARPPLLCASAFVLLKYPAFVYLLSDPASDSNVAMIGVLVLIYACFLAYECLHDSRLRTATGTIVLASALLAMTVATMLARSMDWLTICWLAPGVGVLAWLCLRHFRRLEPGVWPHGVFVVGFSWMFFAYLLPRL